ncbi:MAG: hypothetical protein QMC85_06595 [Methanocellales archaeon]|nr:hypothetical protein [Methanocellales archaeon]
MVEITQIDKQRGCFIDIAIPTVAPAVHPYVGDETEVTGTYTVYHEEKTFRFLRDDEIFQPSMYKFGAEVKSTGGTATLGVYVEGVAGTVELKTESTTYAVLVGSKDVSGLKDGVHPVHMSLKVNRGTYWNRLFDNYLVG